MGEHVLELGNEELKKIGDYVQGHLSEWIRGANVIEYKTHREIELIERMVRVEEELKNQRELMNLGFTTMNKRFEDIQAQMEKRFEQVDKRFEQVDIRFKQMFAYFTTSFVILAALMSLYQFLG